jgi:hypothetical protein
MNVEYFEQLGCSLADLAAGLDEFDRRVLIASVFERCRPVEVLFELDRSSGSRRYVSVTPVAPIDDQRRFGFDNDESARRNLTKDVVREAVNKPLVSVDSQICCQKEMISLGLMGNKLARSPLETTDLPMRHRDSSSRLVVISCTAACPSMLSPKLMRVYSFESYFLAV